MTFPPPDPNHQINPTAAPSAVPGGSSRRTASIVALTSGLLIGGVLVGSQFVSANTPNVVDDPTTSSTDVPEAQAPSDDTIEPSTDDADASVPNKADWMDLGGLFELDPEVTAQFEEFEACISEQLGDLDVFGGFDVIGEDGVIPPFEQLDDFDFDMLEDFEIPSGVFVEAGDDTGFYEFGDGDGTITITKSGDDVSVSSNGDVNVQTFELPDFGLDGDFSFPEITSEQKADLDSTWEAVENACGDLLPDDFLGGMLDGVFSGGPFGSPSDD
jgi:hypothetical protein